MKKLILVLGGLLSGALACASTPDECIKKADGARAEMLLFKDGKSSEQNVRQAAKDAGTCIDAIEAKGKDQHKAEAAAAWKAFCKLREDKILPTVIRYNKLTKDNKLNLDKTKAALKDFGDKGSECSEKADMARAALLLFKVGKGDEAVVASTALETSKCIDDLDANGKASKKEEAVAAWKAFRAIREGKIVPDVKYFMQQSGLNTANLEKTKAELAAITR